MRTAHLVRLLAVVTTCVWLSAAAGEAGDGALLGFKVSSSAVAEAGSINRASVKSAVLVAFNEKFTMQASPYRLELTAAEQSSAAAKVTVTLFDARAEPPVLVGTAQIQVPVEGGSVAQMTGADGTAYAVSLEFKRAKLPPGKS